LNAENPIVAFAVWRTRYDDLRAEQPLIAATSNRAWLAHIPTGDGWVPQLTVCNLSDHARRLTIKAWDGQGSLLDLDEFELQAGQTRTLPIPTLAHKIPMALSMTIQGQDPWLCQQLLGLRDSEDRAAFQVGEGAARELVVGLPDDPLVFAGLALLNTSDTACTISFLDGEGTVTKTFEVAPWQKWLGQYPAGITHIKASQPLRGLLVYRRAQGTGGYGAHPLPAQQITPD
jgi:hypothetical protein